MTPREIEMCVLDCLQDDGLEDVATLLRSLNGTDDHRSWETARGMAFSQTEVRSALTRLMEQGLVTPTAEQPPRYEGTSPIPMEAVGVSVPWAEVWFHINPEGRAAVREWWDTEGCAKYPLQ